MVYFRLFIAKVIKWMHGFIPSPIPGSGAWREVKPVMVLTIKKSRMLAMHTIANIRPGTRIGLT